MNAVRIVILSVLAAIAYGVIHDQITARICVEYFTIGHPPILHTHSPTLLGIIWGIRATWWAGLFIGVPLAMIAQSGRLRRKIGWFELIKPVAVLLAIMAIVAFCAGAVAYRQADRGIISLQGELSDKVPFEAQTRFIAVMAAHLASYAAGFVGGLVLCGYVWVRRWRTRQATT